MVLYKNYKWHFVSTISCLVNIITLKFLSPSPTILQYINQNMSKYQTKYFTVSNEICQCIFIPLLYLAVSARWRCCFQFSFTINYIAPCIYLLGHNGCVSAKKINHFHLKQTLLYSFIVLVYTDILRRDEK